MGQSPNVQVARARQNLAFPTLEKEVHPIRFALDFKGGCDAQKFLLNSAKHPFKLRRVNPLKNLPVQVLL